MPALMTHYLFARRVEAMLTANDARPSALSPSAMYWGAQGPDFLFYHRALPHQLGKSFRRLGSDLHRADPAVTFGHMADYTRRCPLQSRVYALSFAYGFLCHLALDSTVHPFVYWFQGELARKTGGRPAFMHHKIEHNLDTILLLRERGTFPSAFNIEEALPDDPAALAAAARMMRYVFARMYPEKKISAAKLLEAFRDSKLSSGLLQDKKGRKRRLLLRAESKVPARVSLSSFICPDRPDGDWDYPNLSHRPWADQGKGGGILRTDDFFVLFENGVSAAAGLCRSFRACVEEKKPVDFLGDYDFHNGGA